MDELVDRIRHAADQTGEEHFLELLRWHRVVAGLPEPDWEARGAYRIALTELGEDRAAELLGDLRRLARNPRRYRNGADGKPRYRAGRTIRDQQPGK
ncbi:hypothetical protein M3D00_17220 [Dietzia cinnamea]|uniref:hypothetical protein n=1 Tax=Dietzia cinnamea TaxID=321318 RepID=UPI0021A2A303|nr:hypothetical protein [Dietzia cinnamea]MCT2031871.1 hypothetical protein [Dietzia cinnamea]